MGWYLQPKPLRLSVRTEYCVLAAVVKAGAQVCIDYRDMIVADWESILLLDFLYKNTRRQHEQNY